MSGANGRGLILHVHAVCEAQMQLCFIFVSIKFNIYNRHTIYHATFTSIVFTLRLAITEQTDNGGFPSSTLSYNTIIKKADFKSQHCDKSTVLVRHYIIFPRYMQDVSVNRVTVA